MIIAIDIGNTNVVVGCMEGEEILFTARLKTDPSKTKDEYAVMLLELFKLYKVDLEVIEGSIISSVVPQLRETFNLAMAQLTKKRVLVVGAGVKTGLNILVDNPGAVGSDIIVGAVAALEHFTKPIIIFDMGTATTLAAIDEHGNYVGYMIIPGVRSSVDALAMRTSQLPSISLEATNGLLGKNTVDAMRTGAIYGNAAMIDGLIDRVEEQVFKAKATVVATGGLVSTISPYCRHEIIEDEYLLLRGLAVLYRKNSHAKDKK